MDPAKRKSIVDEMQKIFYEDSAYQILWYQDKLQAYRTDRWTGFVDTPGGVIYNVTYDNYLHIKPVSE
jgi:peptide/nickel transport system substrate-binding protein